LAQQALCKRQKAGGVYVEDCDGKVYLDFASAYATLNLGYNHPDIEAALDRVRNLANLVEGPGQLVAALAHNLTAIAPGNLTRVVFVNSGSEAVDVALKLARAATGRQRLIACQKCFHGRTVGALSIIDRREFRQHFEPLLQSVGFVPFGDSEALEAALRAKDVAGFVVEPIQGEGGIVVPPDRYLSTVRDLCSRYGTMMIADEIQTGLGRTGQMFAVEHENVAPDALLLGKALGGGAMPISAVLTTEDHWKAAHGGTPSSPFQFPTFGGNTRACAAALATLEVLHRDRLVQRSAMLGAWLMERLLELQKRHKVIEHVRGRGLMIGIEFAPAVRGIADMVTGGVLNRLSHDYFAGLILKELRENHKIITLNTLNDANVLRAQPPLIIEQRHADAFVSALDEVLQRLNKFTSAAIASWRLLVRAQNA
jgi:putrescine aminotransferase